MMDTFSKTFASNGSFVAVRKHAIKQCLRFYSAPAAFPNAMSPVNAAIVIKAFEIIEAPEVAVLRDELMGKVLALRRQLTAAGLDYYGDPSSIVAVNKGTEAVGRLVERCLPDFGLLCNLVKYPAGGKGSACFRVQVIAKHSAQNVANAVSRIKQARLKAEIETMGEATSWMRVVF